MCDHNNRLDVENNFTSELNIELISTSSTPKGDTLDTIHVELSSLPNTDSNNEINEKARLSTGSDKVF